MNRSIKLFLAASVIVLFVAAALTWTRGKAEMVSQTEAQQSNDTMRTVHVTGVAESQVEPDTAVIRLGVQTEAKTAQAALDQNSRSAQSLINRLRTADIPASNIQTQTVNLSPRYDFDAKNNDRTLLGYTAYNVVEVRSDDLKSLGTLLDQSVESGANIIESVRFEVSDPSRVIEQLRQTAVENARQKAQSLARLTGATLGPILEIQESSRIPQPVPVEAAAPTNAGAVPISPGTQTVSIHLDMTWTLNVDTDQ